MKNLETQERELAAKAAANLKVGNRNAAGQYALQLKTVKEQLEENRKQLESAEETYKKLVKSRDVTVRDAQDKIEKLKRMMTETEMLEAQAELQEMATGMIDLDRRLGRHAQPRRGVPDRAARQGGRPRARGRLHDRHGQGGADGGGAAGAGGRGAHGVRRGLRAGHAPGRRRPPRPRRRRPRREMGPEKQG